MSATHKKAAAGKSGRNQFGNVDPVESLLADLASMGVGDLRALWRKRFRQRLPELSSSDLLRRLIAWKIQVQANGGFDAETSRQLKSFLRSADKRKPGDSQAPPLLNLRPGTILVREWRGVQHRVLVLETGFEYRDKHFATLSHAARHISGTHWSGPRFFGLEPQQLKRK